jgi:cytoskeletal protein CcmA (bactofilin family)
MKIEGNIQIEGLIKGTLTSKGKVVIGSAGVVEGDVLCQHAEISGKVNGKLKIADILFLKSSAKVDGDIQTGKLVMESGVQFNGNCSMGTAATVPASAPKPSTPPPTATSSSSTPSNAG